MEKTYVKIIRNERYLFCLLSLKTFLKTITGTPQYTSAIEIYEMNAGTLLWVE